MTTTKVTKKAVKEAAKTQLEKAVAAWIVSHMDDYDGSAAGVLNDLWKGGCSSGIVGGLIYYKDTIPFAEKYLADILQIAVDQADEMGEKNCFALIGSLNGAENCGDSGQALNLLAWYGFEEAARIIAGRLEIET